MISVQQLLSIQPLLSEIDKLTPEMLSFIEGYTKGLARMRLNGPLTGNDPAAQPKPKHGKSKHKITMSPHIRMVHGKAVPIRGGGAGTKGPIKRRKHKLLTNAEVFGTGNNPLKSIPHQFLEAFEVTGRVQRLKKEWRDIFIGRLANYQVQQNLSDRELANLAYPAIVSPTTISSWRAKLSSPQLKTVVMLCRKLKLAPKQLGLPDVTLP